MKNTVKILVCLALVLGTLFCLTACDSGTSSSVQTTPPVREYITGRYELDEIRWANGTTASGDVLQSSEDAMGDMYVELFSDHTAQLSLYGRIMDMEYTDTEMTEINTLSEKFDVTNNTYEFSVSGGKVTLKKDGDTYIFVKA